MQDKQSYIGLQLHGRDADDDDDDETNNDDAVDDNKGHMMMTITHTLVQRPEETR